MPLGRPAPSQVLDGPVVVPPSRSLPKQGWRVPATLLLLISAIVLTDAAVIDHQRAAIVRDLAAEAGKGPTVALRPRAVRHAAPVSLTIGRLGIRSSLVDLRKQPNGALEVPKDFGQVGWYVGSAHPGDPGPTVLVGHVDSYKGPAVFFRLRQLHPGDRIVVGRADRTEAQYVVQQVRRYRKSAFPTAQVYVGNGRPSLRLVTCGGPFDRSSGHYLDNTVVFAVPAPASKAAVRPRPRVASAARSRTTRTSRGGLLLG